MKVEDKDWIKDRWAGFQGVCRAGSRAQWCPNSLPIADVRGKNNQTIGFQHAREISCQQRLIPFFLWRTHARSAEQSMHVYGEVRRNS